MWWFLSGLSSGLWTVFTQYHSVTGMMHMLFLFMNIDFRCPEATEPVSLQDLRMKRQCALLPRWICLWSCFWQCRPQAAVRLSPATHSTSPTRSSMAGETWLKDACTLDHGISCCYGTLKYLVTCRIKNWQGGGVFDFGDDAPLLQLQNTIERCLQSRHGVTEFDIMICTVYRSGWAMLTKIRRSGVVRSSSTSTIYLTT